MKGIIFTLDAIISFGIVILLISGLVLFRTEIISPFLAAQQLHSLSEDVLTVLSNSKLGDVINQTLLNQYLLDGTLNQSDLDKKTIDVLGALWAAGKKDEAANITKYALNDFIPPRFGYGFLINGDNVYNSSDTARPSHVSATAEISSGRVISGYEKYRPTEGYVARAIARSIKKNNTLVVMGDVITSSVKSPQNEVNISYIADIPSDATILDTYWFIEATWGMNNKFKCWVNGKEIPGCAGSIGNTKLDSGDYMQYLKTGRNIGNVVFQKRSDDETAGDDGATHLVITYNTTLISTLEQFEKQYFQTVRSNASIEYKKPVFVPGDVLNLSVRLNVTPNSQVQNLTLLFMWNGVSYLISNKTPVNGLAEWNDAEIRNVLNSNGISYNTLKGRFFWFIVYIDTYHESETMSYGRFLDGNDSYVYVNFVSPGEMYNYIDLTKELLNYSYEDVDPNFGVSDFFRYVKWNFNLTHKIPLLAKWQYAWGYLDGSNPKQLARANNILLYNHDPANASSDPLIKAFSRFGYDPNPEGVLIDGNNKFELNFTNGYSINPKNSLGKTTFLVPASVGYSELFATEIEATNDAIQRLQEVLGDDISAMEMIVDAIKVAGVPYMWGPVSARVRMWL